MALGKRLARSTRALSDHLEPSVRRAFRRSVRDLLDNVDFEALEAAIREGDVDAAVDAVNSDDAWEALRVSVEKAFAAGGTLTMNLIAEEARRARRG